MTIDPYDQLFAADESLDRSRLPDPLEELFAEDEPLARLYIDDADDCFEPTGESSPSPPTPPRAPAPADAPAPAGFVNDDVGRIACPRASPLTDAGRRWFPISPAPAGSPRHMSRPASVLFTDSDPTRGRNELAPSSPPRDALPLQLAPLLPPGWGRPGCSRRTTTAPTQLQAGHLVRDEGPLLNESSENYVWRRSWAVSIEFERLWPIYQRCADLSEMAYGDMEVAEVMQDILMKGLRVCAQVRRDIRRWGGTPPSFPDEYQEVMTSS